MKMPEIKLNNYQLFTLFVIFWIGLGILGLLLTMAGIFFKAFFLVYFGLFGLLFLYLFFLNIKAIKFTWHFSAVLMISLIAIFAFSYFTTPTIFSGRDQGSLSETAIRLSQNHKLESSFLAEKSFFNIYGAGKALNFPGFNYTTDGSLKTSFPLGYSSWLAIFYSFFGLAGFIVANALSFLIFILSFYLMSRVFLKPSSSLVLVVLTLTSFVFSWFFKFTLSENLALALLWFSIYEFILFFKNKERFFFLASLLSMGFLAFIRIEAVAFFVLMIAILFFKYKNWKNLSSVIGQKIILIMSGIILIYLINLVINKEFYIILIKAAIKPFVETRSDPAVISNFSSIFYVSHVFFSYALFNFLLFGIIGIIYIFQQKQWKLLAPFLIISPTFLYLFIPNISPDNPWMLRRFLFAVIPTCIFYTICLLDSLFKKRFYFYLTSFLLLFVNLSIFIPYLSFSPNKNLLPQVKVLSEKFNDSDLILIDREATGDAWSMMTGPMNFLYNKQAVYFFNPEDLNKLDLTKFNRVYFIIPDKNIDFYKKFGLYSRLAVKEDYVIKNNVLDTSNQFDLPGKRDIIITGKIYFLK
jgi:hypothetical protein